jgi:hypothetical protein
MVLCCTLLQRNVGIFLTPFQAALTSRILNTITLLQIAQRFIVHDKDPVRKPIVANLFSILQNSMNSDPGKRPLPYNLWKTLGSPSTSSISQAKNESLWGWQINE